MSRRSHYQRLAFFPRGTEIGGIADTDDTNLLLWDKLWLPFLSFGALLFVHKLFLQGALNKYRRAAHMLETLLHKIHESAWSSSPWIFPYLVCLAVIST
ncbi:hypothetical protein K461DRAFT_274819 [Myriangium duriaei CBS 260.36]|uniref:Uncharacterized protein n=1 Tax=Myriangium duriaei CBS 260.36 TaxID=1168546 RepID=A0A9P4MQN9_9PEZI|nr:hypothetical protein K461DRAFT_274819 [Myriangium duriaei CBS 260.36]